MAGRVVSLEEMHEGSGQLLGTAAGPLAFELVPVPVPDRQQAMQRDRLLNGPLRPGWGQR